MEKLLGSLVIFFLSINLLLGQDFCFTPHSKNKEIVRHTGYTLSYIEKFEEPEWVAYKLSRDMLNGSVKRTNKFIIDPSVSTGSASPKDYTGSGYDKGHLCPAADMNSSAILMKESFYISNMTPQDPSFNRGIWSRLEELVRSWAELDSLIYVVTGPIFSENMQFIGIANRIAVPQEFYKVILDYRPGHKPKAIGFILKNEGSREPLTNFIATVDSVENKTGIDFFPNLPDEIEEKVESISRPEEWNFNVQISKRN